MRGPFFRMDPARVVLFLFAYGMATPGRHLDAEQLTVGVQGDPLGNLVQAMHVVVRVGGRVAVDETVRPPPRSHGPFPVPWEQAVHGATGSPVDVTVEALGAPGAAPLLTRLASTRLIAGRTPLLRVQLESRCMVFPAQPGTGKVPGPLSGPTCAPPSTCIQGVCQSGAVATDNLEPYAPGWPKNAPDRCNPRRGGDPTLQVGTGQTDYLPLTPGETLQAEAGPQGGHHIWIATRMKNLKQTLTTTRIEGIQPETHVTIPPSTFVFTYAPAEGGFCKLYGLRYQLDNGGIDYQQFLGKPLDVRVTLNDPNGATVTTTTRIQVAPTLRNP